jgi:hypothetical protein
MTALGTVQTVVTCVAGVSGIQGACPAGSVETVTTAYLVAASEATRLELMADPFDAATAGGYFGFAFAATVFVYLLSFGAGIVIKMVRQG